MEKNWVLYICLSLFTTSCIDEVKLNQEDFQSKLIVDGSISNASGPYRVLLNYSLPYTEAGLTQTVSGANVSIVEEGGQTVNLIEVSTGIYETADSFVLKGQIGKSYYLKIRTANGREYQSRPEKILPPVPIDTFKVAFQPKQAKPFELSIKTKDPVEKGNFYRWKWMHYDSISICKTSLTKNEAGNFSYKSFCCEKCWSIETCSGCIDIGSDALINGKYIEPTIARLPYESKRPYFVIVEQHSVSKEYYQFWQLVSTQINNSGGIFDNAPAQIQGNIFGVTDPNEQVLGYFSATGVTLKPIYVPRDFTNYAIRPPATPSSFEVIYLPNCQPCRGISKTPIKPLGWIE
ncbi:MAG: DUF4249 domain-containing protein [Saprospiraceae bacterium]|nr:DUF4249 domain-containing protein [Saprospiraceae bacterium]